MPRLSLSADESAWPALTVSLAILKTWLMPRIRISTSAIETISSISVKPPARAAAAGRGVGDRSGGRFIASRSNLVRSCFAEVLRGVACASLLVASASLHLDERGVDRDVLGDAVERRGAGAVQQGLADEE